MKKSLLAALLLLLSFSLRAQDIVTNDHSDDDYSDEIGFFQKAYRDKSDPRFMFRDGNFEFGVGGRIQSSLYCDFAGAIDDVGFLTSKISIPSDKTPSYGMSIGGSNVYFKARAQVGKHKLLAYTQININSSDMARFNQAYISFDNFTVGKTYSFFSDLEAGPRSMDVSGVNAEISNIHPLVGFTWRISPKLSLGAAIEKSELNLSDYASYGIDTNYQPVPDIAMRLKYKGEKGHVQIAGLIRNLAYWVYNPPKTSETDGESRYTFAWGTSLSGNWIPAERIRFSAQIVAGRGIAAYIRDFTNRSISLAVEEEFLRDLPVLKPRFTAGGFLSGQVKWSETLSSNFTGGYANAVKDPGTNCGSELKSTLYSSANLIYDLSNYCFMGLEYIHGRSDNNYTIDASCSTGRANRLLFVFSYSF